MKTHSRYRTARGWLLFWCLFIGIGAVGGAVGMLVAIDGSAMGMQELLPYFQVLPLADILFQDFLFPGIALLCVNGIPNLAAAGLILARRRSGILCGGIFGVTLMLWICIQFVIFPPNFMSTTYFFFGMAQAAAGHAAGVFRRQEEFAFDPADYPHIGADKRQLVVYFSRMGYVRRLAYQTADALGADIYAIKATERTEGTLGFWWCGRFGMHRWDMPIETPEIDPSAYEKVTICSPVWVFALAAPVRAFCRFASGRIKRADYTLAHFQRAGYGNVAAELDSLLGLRHERLRSVCCRAGKYISDTTTEQESEAAV